MYMLQFGVQKHFKLVICIYWFDFIFNNSVIPLFQGAKIYLSRYVRVMYMLQFGVQIYCKLVICTGLIFSFKNSVMHSTIFPTLSCM